MPIKIKVADTTDLIDQAFRLRHKVFVEQEGLLQGKEDKRILDRFDAFPSSANLVAMHGDKAVGTFRLSIDSSQGMPADDYFNFRDHLPEDATIMHCGLFCVDKDFRCTGMAMGLILMSSYFALTKNVTHIVAPINPVIAGLLRRIGFTQVGEVFNDPHAGVPVMPLIMDLADLNDFFLNFIKHNELHDFLQDYQRWFYHDGEMVIKAGSEGTEAYVIIEGSVEVRLPGSEKVIATLGEGEMLGELALITDEPRSADVVAKGELVMMVISKEVFLERFVSLPEHALKLVRVLGRRTQDMIKQMQSQ